MSPERGPGLVGRPVARWRRLDLRALGPATCAAYDHRLRRTDQVRKRHCRGDRGGRAIAIGSAGNIAAFQALDPQKVSRRP